MHTDDLTRWTHDHAFNGGDAGAERSTWIVMWITAAAMLVEIAAGWWFNSMALLADGWHMSSHAVAIGLSAMAYATARRYAGDVRFTFGTWKIEILGGFASAILAKFTQRPKMQSYGIGGSAGLDFVEGRTVLECVDERRHSEECAFAECAGSGRSKPLHMVRRHRAILAPSMTAAEMWFCSSRSPAKRTAA